jgi:hypothetical protein
MHILIGILTPAGSPEAAKGETNAAADIMVDDGQFDYYMSLHELHGTPFPVVVENGSGPGFKEAQYLLDCTRENLKETLDRIKYALSVFSPEELLEQVPTRPETLAKMRMLGNGYDDNHRALVGFQSACRRFGQYMGSEIHLYYTNPGEGYPDCIRTRKDFDRILNAIDGDPDERLYLTMYDMHI